MSTDPNLSPAPRYNEKQWERYGRVAGLVMLREPGVAAKLPVERPAIGSPRDVYEFMKDRAARELAEVFWALLLDSQHQVLPVPICSEATGRLKEIVIGPVTITRGILNSSLVHPREAFRPAIAYGAAAIICVHNHPSGDPTASADDRIVTEQMVSAGRLLDIAVHDHIIIGRGRYVSFAEQGLL